jgi:twinkle protein
MTPREIAERLARDAEGIARLLLPNGKREGAEWRVGSVAGDAGKSLGVHLAGGKAGVWSDFASGEGGDLLDLWAAARSLSLREAIQEAKTHLGITEPHFRGHQPKRYSRPKPKGCQDAKPDSLVSRYLVEERALLFETLSAYRIAERGSDIVFPSFRDGQLVGIKYLGVDRIDGKKRVSVEPDCEPSLFGWQAIPDNARTVAITEGEIDAMTLHQLGVPALSVPFGGGKGEKQRWIESEFEHLERFDTLYLCLDGDQPGREATEVIAERLGRHRCKVVDLPAGVKDANDLLGSGTTAEEVRALFARARTLDPVELKAAQTYVDDVLRQFYPADTVENGFQSPWEHFSDRFAFRPGEKCPSWLE